MKILVTGATGGVGGGVVAGLLAAGATVRALSRDPGRARVPAGVELVAGDLNAPATMHVALAGVDAVFLYAQGGDLAGLTAVMKRAGVKRVVVLSTIDATNDRAYARYNRQRHLAVEEAVAGAGFQYTCLRPGAFATNALRFFREGVAKGVVRLPFPDSEQAPIDELDIAAVAVRALTSGDLDGQKLVLTGPESLTQRRQIEHIGAALGRTVRIETSSEGEARAALGRVLPPEYVDLLMAQWADEVGTPSEVTDTVERVTGRPATTYKAWVARHVDAFRAG